MRTPGSFASTMMSEIPWCLGTSVSVRTANQIQSAWVAKLVKTF